MKSKNCSSRIGGFVGFAAKKYIDEQKCTTLYMPFLAKARERSREAMK